METESVSRRDGPPSIDGVMAETLLLSVDPDRNRFRFFRLELEENAQPVELHRRWGRVGTDGHHEVERFVTVEAARKRLRTHVAVRVRHGYVDAADEDLREAARALAHRRAARRMPDQLQFPLAAGF